MRDKLDKGVCRRYVACLLLSIRKSLSDQLIWKCCDIHRLTCNQNECIRRRRKNIISTMFCVQFTIEPFPWLMRQVNRGSRSIVSPPSPSSLRPTSESTGTSTENNGALPFVPNRNFSVVRIKDGGPWSSLNFKLKNTVGYIALLENSLRVRAREPFPLPPPRSVLRCETKIRFSNILRPDCNPRVLDFAHWISDRLYNNHAWDIELSRGAIEAALLATALR